MSRTRRGIAIPRTGGATQRLRVLLLAVACVVTALGMAAEPARAQPVPGPTKPADAPDRGICTPLGLVCADDARKAAGTLIPGSPIASKAAEVVAGSLTGAAREVAAATVAWYIETLVAGVSGVLGEFAGFVDATTHPRVTAEAFLQPGGAYHTVAAISVMLLVGFVFLGVIQGLTAGEPGQAMFRVLRDIPVAVLAIVGFPWLVDQLLVAADGLAAGILPSGATTKQLLNNQLLEAVKLAAGGGLAGLLIAALAFAALMLVYLELVVRDVLIYLVVGMASLSFAAFVWPAARGAARKAAEFVGAAILAKPAIFLALRIGLDLTTSHGEGRALERRALGAAARRAGRRLRGGVQPVGDLAVDAARRGDAGLAGDVTGAGPRGDADAADGLLGRRDPVAGRARSAGRTIRRQQWRGASRPRPGAEHAQLGKRGARSGRGAGRRSGLSRSWRAWWWRRRRGRWRRCRHRRRSWRGGRGRSCRGRGGRGSGRYQRRQGRPGPRDGVCQPAGRIGARWCAVERRAPRARSEPR